MNLLNESTALNINNIQVLNDIVPLLIIFRKTVGDSITDYLTLHEDETLNEFLDAIKASVADNIAIMENNVPISRFEKIIPLYYDHLYKVIENEINCRTNAYNDFKSRRNEVKETCFYNRFSPAFDKLTNDTQSFVKDFVKFLRDGQKNAVDEFKVQIAKWTTDIPNALKCGVTGCIADYVTTNKGTILKDINIGHNIKERRDYYMSLFPVKRKVIESMISDEFNGIYKGIKECYK